MVMTPGRGTRPLRAPEAELTFSLRDAHVLVKPLPLWGGKNRGVESGSEQREPLVLSRAWPRHKILLLQPHPGPFCFRELRSTGEAP